MGPKKEKTKKKDLDVTQDEKNQESEDVKDLRNIIIRVEKLENIEPAFTVTDIYVEVKHFETILGQSEKIPALDLDNILINYETEYPINIASEKTFDELLSCPLYFTVWQVAGEADINAYPSRSETSEDSETLAISRGSISSLYEAILGVKWEEVEEEEEPTNVGKKVKIKDQKKNRDRDPHKDKNKRNKEEKGMGSQNNKDSKEEENKKTRGNRQMDITLEESTPICVGSANLDLLPIFLGNIKIEEKVPLNQEKIHTTDELVPVLNLPQLTVQISIDKPFFNNEEEDEKLENLFNVTVESIYNLPEGFCRDFDYKIATLLPTKSLNFKPICIENGVYKEEYNLLPEFKIWPNLAELRNFSSHTTHRIDDDICKIKNKIGVTLNNTVLRSGPRIVWNTLVRCWLTRNATDFLQKTIIKYRRWPIEINLTPTEKKSTDKAKIDKKSKSSNDSKGSKDSKSDKINDSAKKCILNPEYQHLMGFVDISSILYPGVTRTRVACELRTFQQKEFTRETGFDDSYFAPKPPQENISKKQETAKDAKKDKKAGKGKDNISKRDKKGSEKSIEKERLPDVEAEPSKQLSNEKGASTFIIIDFELLKPFQERRSLSDITSELLNEIPHRMDIQPSVLNIRYATIYYRETIAKLASEINSQYQDYQEESNKKELNYFIKFLQQKGAYQTYYTTFARAVVNLTRENFCLNDNFQNAIAYVNYATNVYNYLQNILNTEIHDLMSCDLIKCSKFEIKEIDYIYLANEAVENNAIVLAERYHLQALNRNVNDPTAWFHFAVYHLELQNLDKAFECLKEALALQVSHKYSLLLFGITLFEKNDYHSSEITLLSLTKYHPQFLEGWVCLYLLYQKKCQFEGCDFCLEMIVKHQNYKIIKEADHIHRADGLSWTTAICNSDNIFYRTALLLIKIRALKFADMALSTDNFCHDGVYMYYQAVILYFAKDYEHALKHLEVAQKLHGPDYAVNSLIGHCHFKLGSHKEAKKAYKFVVESFNRPDDMHMLYMNLSYIYEAEKNTAKARKYITYVCKYSPTPYSWLLLGILFYKEINYLNAEACLEESNILDLRMPETWAYLVLVNIKIGKHWEAQQCYSQMERFNLNNDVLLSEVQNEMQKIQKII